MNLIINLEHDDDILRDDSVTLASVGIGTSPRNSLPSSRSAILTSSITAENESEISFFNGEIYEAFKKNPQQSW